MNKDNLKSSPTASSSSNGSSNNATNAANSYYPTDWPAPNVPIDLDIHDLPHFSSSAEWWYVNAHLDVTATEKDDTTTNKRKGKKKKKKPKKKKAPNDEKEEEEQHPGLSLFASFFRRVIDYDDTTKEYVYGHGITWAVSDHSNKKYYNVSLLAKRTPEDLLATLKGEHSDDFMSDQRLKRATIELLEKGVLAYPDRLLQKDPLILGRDLSRLPAESGWQGKSIQELYAAAGTNKKMNTVLPEQTKQEDANTDDKPKKTSCCCFGRGAATSILASVASSGGLPRLSLDFDNNCLTRNKDGSYDLVLIDPDVHHVQVKLHFVPNTEAIRNGIDGVVDGEGAIEDMFYYSLPHCTVTGTVTLPEEIKEDRNDAKIQRKDFFVIAGEEDMVDTSVGAAANGKTGKTMITRPPVQTYTHQVSGTGWYDHQFGVRNESKKRASDKKENDLLHQDIVDAAKKDSKVVKPDAWWTWLSLQLGNGYQLCCSEHFLFHDHRDREHSQHKFMMTLVDPQGKRHQVDQVDMTFETVGDYWCSMRTFRDYPVKWAVKVPSRGIDITVEAVFAQQEFATIVSAPAFWEGCVKAKGTFNGKEVTAKGFVERSGFAPPNTISMEYFFKCVSRETLKSVHKILPFNPTGDKFNELVSRKENTHYTEYIDSEQYSKAMVEPIRAIIDRGGKSWRSYAALACCDMVGGNSQDVQDWLALPELMHVGSLIVDDVEDRSTIRRGGPCSHLLYGEDVAINAGTNCYFLGQICVYQGNGDPQQQVDIYNLYFEALRAAHSGQAMDIHGLEYMMPDVVENGGDLCRQRVLAIHRLKSAVPASSLAGMGCKLGGGSKTQSKALSDYFEALGIAFQIVDDVLNLKGFRDGLKTKGEDITAGKVTYPIAKAMGRLEKQDRSKLWDLVSSKPEDIEIIGEAVALIDKVHGIDDSYKEAKDIMEDAWRKVDPLLRDSMVKLNLRAFSWYVLDRTY